jgi:serine/threonine-protein kinase
VDKLLELEDQVLGHFKIGALLGRGHSSLVFRALDQKNNQSVALKVLSPDFPKTDAELQRFVRAMKVLPQLAHTNLPVLYGAGRTGAYCWIAREHVEGESVARQVQRLKEGAAKFDWTRACRVAVHLGNVLDFLHGHKVTHGNLTPRNILVRVSDRATKLADLMLNQALEGSQLQKAILGRKLVAELAYMPPEQTDPHAPATPVADLYALGAVLYALLTGEPPFSGETPKEVLTQVRTGKVAKPSRHQKGIPADFEAAVLKLLARRPEDRFQSAVEMLAAIDPLIHEHEIKL